MKNIFIITICLFIYNCCAQEKKETIYLLFDNNNKETCKIEAEFSSDNDEILDGYKKIKKYRKIENKKRTTFYICEESFLLDRRNKIDTCDIKYLSTIKFETLQTIESKRVISKYAFKNSVFEKIFLIEKQKDKVIKYPVIWNTDLVQK